MNKEAIYLDGRRLGPYSDAIRVAGLVFVSGRIGLAEKGQLADGGIAAQTKQAVGNLQSVLAATNLTLGDVIKCTVYLVSMDDFDAMNAAYIEAFGDHRPARTAVAVKELPLGACFEIDAIAAN